MKKDRGKLKTAMSAEESKDIFDFLNVGFYLGDFAKIKFSGLSLEEFNKGMKRVCDLAAVTKEDLEL